LTYAGSKFGTGTDAQSTIDNFERLVHELQNRNYTQQHVYNTYVISCAPNKPDEKSVFDDFDSFYHFDEKEHFIDNILPKGDLDE
jgi:hypothetical protein